MRIKASRNRPETAPGPNTGDATIDMKPQPQPSTREVLAGLIERVTYDNSENGFCVLLPWRRQDHHRQRRARSVNGRSTMSPHCGGDARRHTSLIDVSDWELPMPNHELKLATAHADVTSDEPAVQSESTQDLKQFSDFSLGEIAVAAVSRPGSNYSKAAEIEFRRREVVIQIEALEAQKAVAEAQKAAVEAQKAVAEAQRAAALPLSLTGWGTIGLAAATFILALLTACDGPLAAACSRLGRLLAG
jgi:hypothetical protein